MYGRIIDVRQLRHQVGHGATVAFEAEREKRRRRGRRRFALLTTTLNVDPHRAEENLGREERGKRRGRGGVDVERDKMVWRGIVRCGEVKGRWVG